MDVTGYVLSYEEVSWPRNGEFYGVEKRGRLPDKKGHFALEIAIKGPAKKQGRLNSPMGVELTIKQDDFGFFKDTKNIFWAIDDVDASKVRLARTYSRSHGLISDPKDLLGADGESSQLIFFFDNPGTELVLPNSPDTLQFHGKEQRPWDPEGKEYLHFTRTVYPDRHGSGDGAFEQSLNQGFVEDLWYGSRKGLVRREQRVGDQLTMVWTLKNFADGK